MVHREAKSRRRLNMADETIDLSPPPGNIIHTLRSLGYTTPTAIADLIDNSITAGATQINVHLDFNKGTNNSIVTVSDNGSGMDLEELKEAMRPGTVSPHDNREVDDLGRFGLGMKTASWSMGKIMTTRSKKGRSDNTLRWDLDFVEKKKKWLVQMGAGDLDKAILKLPADAKNGTIVAISKCDKILGEEQEDDPDEAETAFYETVEKTRTHIEMVFHRFLARREKITIHVNGNRCEPWDPFMQAHKYTQRLQADPEIYRCHGEDIEVAAYVLPHKDNLTDAEYKRAAGPKDWNLQQGFYIYRADRLIVPGGWFGRGSKKPAENTKLARVSVDLTQEMDAAWNLNVLKSEARSPASLYREFGAIAAATRKKAIEAYEYRGNRSIAETNQQQQNEIIPLWAGEEDSENGKLLFKINHKHPLVEYFLRESTPGIRRSIKRLLRNLEKTIPIAKITSAAFEDESTLVWSEFDAAQMSDDLKHIYKTYKEDGFTFEATKNIVLTIQPFCEHPGIVEAVFEELENE